MKILIVHRYFWPENISTYPIMLKEIAEFHQRAGHHIKIVTASTTDSSADQVRKKWAAEQGIQISEIKLKLDRGNSNLNRIISTFRFTLFTLGHCIFGKYDAVSIASYPFIITPASVILSARLRRKSSLLYMQDILSSRLKRSHSPIKRLIGRVAAFIERRLVSLATIVVTLSSDMQSTLASGGNNITVLQNFFEPSADIIETTKKEKPTFIYAGNIGVAQNLGHILNAFARAAEHVDFSLKILGGGSEASTIENLIQQQGYNFVEMKGYVARDIADIEIRNADFGIVASEPYLFQSAYPSKTLSYLKFGLAVLVICEPEIECTREFEQNQVGAIGSPDNIDQLSSTIADMVNGYNTDRYTKTNIQDWGEKMYGLQAYLYNYASKVSPQWLN